MAEDLSVMDAPLVCNRALHPGRIVLHLTAAAMMQYIASCVQPC